MIKPEVFLDQTHRIRDALPIHVSIMKIKSIPAILLTVALALQAAGQGADTLHFAKIISDNMVLQQQKPITIWGWAKPGAAVNVTLTQDATLGQAAANKLGKTPDVD